MEETKISIIVPSYNQGSYISNVIESVLNQSYNNWELIIQDGASKDQTADVCQAYANRDKRISFFSEKDKGFADAVNKALDKATGEIAVIQSSDDFFAYKNVFRDVINIYKENPELILIAGSAVVVDVDLKHLKTSSRTDGFVQPENIFTLKSHFSQGATFFKLERAKAIGKVDASVDMVADTDFWIRMCCYEPVQINAVYQTSKIWACVLIQPEQRSADYSKFYTGRAKMAVNHLNNKHIEFNETMKRQQAGQVIKNGINHFLANNLDPAMFYQLYRELYQKDYNVEKPGSSSIKSLIKRILGRVEPSGYVASPNSMADVYFNNNTEATGLSYKWFS